MLMFHLHLFPHGRPYILSITTSLGSLGIIRITIDTVTLYTVAHLFGVSCRSWLIAKDSIPYLYHTEPHSLPRLLVTAVYFLFSRSV